jgi:hypothetical protein
MEEAHKMDNNIKGNNIDQDLIKRISTRAAMDIAPDETQLVDSLVDSYFSANRIDYSAKVEDSLEMPLAFTGQSDPLLTLIIPLAVATVTKLITTLTDDGYKGLKDAINKRKKQKKTGSQTEMSMDIRIGEIEQNLVLQIPKKFISPKKAREIVHKIMQMALEELVS